MQTIIQYIVDGWPQKNDVPAAVQTYWPYRDELSTRNSLVYKNDRILIPRDLRKQGLKQS